MDGDVGDDNGNDTTNFIIFSGIPISVQAGMGMPFCV